MLAFLRSVRLWKPARMPISTSRMEAAFLILVVCSVVFAGDEFRENGLNKLNKLRAIHGSGKLELSEELNKRAQDLANKAAKAGSFGGAKPGENVFMACTQQYSRSIKAQDAIDAWYNDVCYPNFTFEKPENEKALGFTQIVWKESKELGLAKAVHEAPDDDLSCTYIVALYRPPGNIAGFYEENVKKGSFDRATHCEKLKSEELETTSKKKKRTKKFSLPSNPAILPEVAHLNTRRSIYYKIPATFYIDPETGEPKEVEPGHGGMSVKSRLAVPYADPNYNSLSYAAPMAVGYSPMSLAYNQVSLPQAMASAPYSPYQSQFAKGEEFEPDIIMGEPRESLPASKNKVAGIAVQERASKKDSSYPGGKDALRKEALAAHNEFRAIHGVPPLELDEQLCAESDEWARTIAQRGSLTHSEAKDYGENLAFGCSGEKKISPVKDSITDWYNEVCTSKYDFNSNEFQSGALHFTQVVWKGSTKLGIGMATSEKDGMLCTYYVGRYKAKGNIVGNFKENAPKGSFDAASTCKNIQQNNNNGLQNEANKNPNPVANKPQGNTGESPEGSPVKKPEEQLEKQPEANPGKFPAPVEPVDALDNSGMGANTSPEPTRPTTIVTTAAVTTPAVTTSAATTVAATIPAVTTAATTTAAATSSGATTEPSSSSNDSLTQGTSATPTTATTTTEPPAVFPSVATTPIPSKEVQDQDEKFYHEDSIRVHNAFRALHKVPALEGSWRLHDQAKKRADEFIATSMVRRAISAQPGENVQYACSPDDKVIPPEESITNWYREVCGKRYNFSMEGPQNAKHFTQIVWRDSNEVGVAYATKKKENGHLCTVVVAKYNPPGNKEGKFLDNVQQGDYDTSFCGALNSMAVTALEAAKEEAQGQSTPSTYTTPTQATTVPTTTATEGTTYSVTTSPRTTEPTTQPSSPPPTTPGTTLSSTTSRTTTTLTTPFSVVTITAPPPTAPPPFFSTTQEPPASVTSWGTTSESPPTNQPTSNAPGTTESPSTSGVTSSSSSNEPTATPESNSTTPSMFNNNAGGANENPKGNGNNEDSGATPFAGDSWVDNQNQTSTEEKPESDDTGDSILKALNAHNAFRKIHGSPPLNLNSEMSREAQSYAKKIAEKGTPVHSTPKERKDQGENIAYACMNGNGNNYTLAEATKDWYREACNPGYNFQETSPVPSGKILQFTQVVWKATTELGIGSARYKKDGMECVYVVARYNKAGNAVNEFLENVHKGTFDKVITCNKLAAIAGVNPASKRNHVHLLDGLLAKKYVSAVNRPKTSMIRGTLKKKMFIQKKVLKRTKGTL